ncbi:nucleotidyltransferase family protein [Candidatus Poribacteria bacterium]
MRMERVSNLTKEQIADFCKKNQIRKFAFYGSVLRGDFRPDSDVDVLVEFEPEQPIGLMEVVGMEIELSEMIGRKVDLRTPEDLSKYFRDKVIAGAEIQYERV